jgi:apolipoprotein N-acyltransferase
VPAEGTTRVAVVQGGVPGDGRDLAGHHREVTTNHVRATTELAADLTERGAPPPDLVVWPENATAVDPVLDPIARASIEEAVEAIGTPILVGGIFDGPDAATAYNRGVVWRPDVGIGATYTKAHPVPFGEYIPWRSVIGDWSTRFRLIPRDFIAGRGDGPLEAGGVLVADAICFDVAYDDVLPTQVRAGAQMVTVQTSNATFFGTSQPEQQFEITRARAVELGRSIAVASTNGVSAIIGPDGQVVRRAPTGETATLVEDVTLARDLTPAVRYQQLRSRLLAGLALLGMLWAARRALRLRVRRRSTCLSEPGTPVVGPVQGTVAGAGLDAVEASPLPPVGGNPSGEQGAGEDDQRHLAHSPTE